MTRPEKFPEFLAEWREVNGEEFTPVAYLHQPEAVRFVIAAQWLYVPDFVEYRGGIFRAELPLGLTDRRRKNLDGWFDKFNGDIPKVENVGNMLSLWGSLLSSDTDQFDEDLSQLARTLARAWDALLRVEFPDRAFQVEVYDDDEEGPQVTFFSRP
jgi:hypothetical protein